MPDHSTRQRSSRRRHRPHPPRTEAETFKLLGHPLRQRVLTALNQRIASPKELADEFGEELGRLSYHVKVLAEAGAIELVRTARGEGRRGGAEHYYRATRRSIMTEADLSRIPPSARRAIGVRTFGEISEHVAEAAEEGAFEDPRVHVSWTTLELEPEAHAELSAELEAVVRRAIDLEAESANRLAKAKGGPARTIRSELAVLHFRRSASEPGRDEAGTRKGEAK